MAMSKVTLASEMITAYQSAGKLDGLPQETIDQLQADMELMFGVLIDHIKANMVVKTTLDSSLNTIFTAGAPIPMDGGTALKTAWSAATAAGVKDNATSTTVE